MGTLVPRLLDDLTDRFDTEFSPRTGYLIRIEDVVGDNEYVLRAELPGLDPEKDIQVLSTMDFLPFGRSGRKGYAASTAPNSGTVLHRSVRLPAGADEDRVTAKYDNGILKVTVPLSASATAGRQISIAQVG